MGASYELQTIVGLAKQAWLHDAGEQNRFRSIVLLWKKENPKASIVQQMLFESLVRIHLFEQRLVDRRRFWNGTTTDYKTIDGRKQIDLSDEDQQRKDQEWDKYYPQVIRWKMDLMKLALAEKIEITGDFDLASLICTYKKDRNGEDRNNPTDRN